VTKPVPAPAGSGPDAAARIGRLAGAGVREVRRIGGQHRWGHYRVVLADGRLAFAKVAGSIAAGSDASQELGAVFEAEARGLRWLAEAEAVPVPDVLGWDAAGLAVSWVPGGAPGAAAAERFGRDLARLHLAGSAGYGAPWPGFIASLPLGNRAGTKGESWPRWYASERLLPYVRRARDAGELDHDDVRLLEQVASRAAALAGPAEPPSRIHGDCWSGNLLWSGGRGWLIDPAAHGGHRETDLAMLALFGAPYLDRILAAYQEAAPLAAGWQARVPLHQLHPLLVHVCLFGGGYRGATLAAARSALAAAR
jgi:fructosamine-3-kinase